MGNKVPTVSAIKDPLELANVERAVPIEIENSQPCALAQKRVDIPRGCGVIRRRAFPVLEDNSRLVEGDRLDRTFKHFPLSSFYIDLDHHRVIALWQGIVEALRAHGNLLDSRSGRIGTATEAAQSRLVPHVYECPLSAAIRESGLSYVDLWETSTKTLAKLRQRLVDDMPPMGCKTDDLLENTAAVTTYVDAIRVLA